MTGDQLDLLGGTGLVEQAARSALAAAAAQLDDERRNHNTERAYAGDWRTWREFVTVSERAGAPVGLLDPSPAALLVFAGWLGKGGRRPDGSTRRPVAPETIRRKLTGVLAGWTAEGVDYPRKVTERAREWVDHYESTLTEHGQPTGRGQAPHITPAQLRAIAATTPDTLSGLRDMALLSLGVAIGARSMELAHLDVDDLAPAERGMTVHVRKTKGKAKPRRPKIPYGANPATCPVACWNRWRQASAIVTGPALRAVTWYGRLGGRMSPEAISDRVTAAGARADLRDPAGTPIRLTGHSLRSGFATAARDAGHPEYKIADHGGWKRGSAALQLYLRNVDEWNDNVLVGIGF